MLKAAERLGLRIVSGKPTENRGYPQERDRARIEQKGADHWARLHERGDKREAIFFPDRRKSHHEMRLTK